WYEQPKKPNIEPGSGIRGNKNYGSTWWGQQWLNAFTQISDANRLPRGRTYANNGSVRTIQLDNNNVEATVQGSYLYKVHIRIPVFSEREQEKITTLIAENPDLLARLLNRELPPELHAACLQAGIQIFPQRWHDFQATCSCPDYAAPCKHLAAIIYLLANEIDKNPFVVFALHRFDVLQALEQEGFSAGQTQRLGILSLASLWLPLEASEADQDGIAREELAKAPIDFSLLPDCRDNLLAILAEKPVFYPGGDFKNVLKKIWTNVAKAAQKELGATPNAAADSDYDRAETVEIYLYEDGVPVDCKVLDAAGEVVFDASYPAALVQWLAGLPAGRLDSFSGPLRGMWLAWRFAEACARHGAFVPQLLSVTGNQYIIRWLPALNQEWVRAIFQQLAAVLPGDALIYVSDDDASVPTKSDYAQALISVFINHYVHTAHGLEATLLQEPVVRLFVDSEPQAFERFETREYPAAIALWLNRFFLAEKETVPVLLVGEPEGLADHFEVSLAMENRRNVLQPPWPLREIFESPAFAATRLELLRDLSTLADFFPDLRRLLTDKGKKPLLYAARDFAQVLFEKLPIISLFGLRVLLPKSLSKILRPQLSLHLAENPGRVFNNSLLSLQGMLQYNWQVAIGDQNLLPDEFLQLLKNAAGLVRIRGEYVYFDEKEMKSLAEKLAKPPALSGPELLQIALAEEYNGMRISLTPELRHLMNELRSTELLPLPAGLQATLRPYQHRGYSWLAKNARIGFGSILADDMGLGKTLQVITTLLHLKQTGALTAGRQALVVAPTTLLTNWQREVGRFAPGLSTFIYHGGARDLAASLAADVVLTSYGVVRSDSAKLEKTDWLALIIDEAQNIKNPGTEQSKALKKIPASIRIAMSGTPVENRLSEYWSVFDFSNKGYLGGPDAFKTRYAIPIEGERDERALQRFRKVTAPFVLRRLKTDKSIISDLPDKVEQNQFCTLAPAQAALYQSVVDRSLAEIAKNEGIARRGMILQLIMALKQICNHPAQFLKKGAPDPDLSGKCPLLLDLVGQALENDEKVLIFTQFREMGELLAQMIEADLGIAAPFLHGGVSRKGRDSMVEDFQEQRSSRLLLLSLKAGGTGLNLTAASQVIHFDLWWNPAVEAQATDRAFRIGQKRNVQVHRFITSATFEERIDAMIQSKKELADLTVAAGETWIGELSDRDLKGLFQLG
ncbi:MAG: DEAD/DEAH box helicase, partial [Saprospiraceae bacterium]